MEETSSRTISFDPTIYQANSGSEKTLQAIDAASGLPEQSPNFEATEVMTPLLPLYGEGVSIAETISLDPSSPHQANLASVEVPGYDILEVLGRGGMGVVYRARHRRLQREVALKMILAGKHEGEAGVARFRAEAAAIARLQHPNIVQVFETGEHDGSPYFSLELVEGGSLAERLRESPLTPRAAGQLMESAMEVTPGNDVILPQLASDVGGVSDHQTAIDAVWAQYSAAEDSIPSATDAVPAEVCRE